MGIIIKQTIRATTWSYIGVVIGFITTTYLYPRFLTPNIVGLFGVLIAYSTIFGRLVNFGSLGVANRMFTLFRDKKNGHNGFLFVSLILNLIGLLCFFIMYYILKPYLIESNLDKSPLLSKYFFLLVPITITTAIFQFLDFFNKVLYDAVLGIFLQDFLQRWLLLAITLLYAFNILDLNQLIIAYAIVIGVKAFILFVYLLKRKEINLRPNMGFIDKQMHKEIRTVAAIGIIGGLSSTFVFQIDKIIISQMLDLSEAGVYTIAFFFGSLVVLPSRPLQKISGTIIADAFKQNDIATIKDIYYKSCLNQLIIGGFLFLGIWSNIDNILYMLGEDYLQSKWVIFFIGIGYLFDMSTGTNTLIISLSKYYKYGLLFTLILIVIEIIAIYLFIPRWEIVGAAMAISIAIFFNNLMRYVFLLKKFKFQPFNYSFIKILFIYLVIYLLLLLIPQQYYILDILLRGTCIVIISLLTFWFIPISPDIKEILLKSRTIINQKLKK